MINVMKIITTTYHIASLALSFQGIDLSAIVDTHISPTLKQKEKDSNIGVFAKLEVSLLQN